MQNFKKDITSCYVNSEFFITATNSYLIYNLSATRKYFKKKVHLINFRYMRAINDIHIKVVIIERENADVFIVPASYYNDYKIVYNDLKTDVLMLFYTSFLYG